MDKKISTMNIEGMFCYGIKVIVKLIKHYKYDYSKWYNLLCLFTDYTLIDEYIKKEGRWLKYWSPSKYSPVDALEPIYMPDKNGKKFLPCDVCGRGNWLYAEYAEEPNFCLNFKNCEYVSNHYRYNRPDKNQYSVGIYKEYYDLYMSADINLLRVIYDTLSLTDEKPGLYFDGKRMPLIEDMLFVCRSVGIEPPDLSGIADEGFGDINHSSFDCINLIN